MFAPNLAWRDIDLKAELEPRVDLPVVIENDANAAAWGEFRFGAGHDVDDLLLVTVGTGVGGGLVLDGELYRGAFGVGAEIGHLRVVPGRHGSAAAATTAASSSTPAGRPWCANAREAAQAGSLLARTLLDRAGGDLDRIDGPMITEAAREGDEFALEQLAELGRWLGEGIASLTAVLDPAVVVIGGGVSEADELLLDPIRAAFAGQLVGPRPPADARDPQGRTRQPRRPHRRRRPGAAVDRGAVHRRRRRRHQGPRRGRHRPAVGWCAPRAGRRPDRRVDATVVEDALTEAVNEVAGKRRVDGVGHRRGRVRRRRGGAGHVRPAPAVARRGGPGPAGGALERAGGARQRRQLRRPRRGRRTARRAAPRTPSSSPSAPASAARSSSTAGCTAGYNGMAGEFGHMQVVPDGRACECGGRGCWEQYSSGNALVRYARARLGEQPTMLSELCGGNPEPLTGPMVTAAAEEGDPLALDGVRRGRRLARRRAWPTWSRRSTPTSS